MYVESIDEGSVVVLCCLRNSFFRFISFTVFMLLPTLATLLPSLPLSAVTNVFASAHT